MARNPAEDDAAPGPARSFAARLRAKHGAGVDPEVTLAGAGAPSAAGAGASEVAGGATDELLRRLGDHSLRQSKYTLEGEIARGGMGAILAVWDADLRRRLAMKVILGRESSPADEGAPEFEAARLSRFLEEAQVTGQLDHPGIVPVHELGLDQDGRVYFTMKLVKGRDLKHVFDLVFEGREGWNETRALSVILRACEALAYAHAKGVIHRDLKPANIMVGGFGEVYVMDWGLARVLGRADRHDVRLAPESRSALSSVRTERREEREELSDSPIVTMDGDVVGTPSYMPPEQACGDVASLSPRSDVYAIGAMLYHLLARHPPYVARGMRVSNRTILALVLHGPPAPLSDVRNDVQSELVAICEKAMAREPERRYADTLALAEDLRAYLEHRVVRAYEAGPWAEARKWVQRNKPLAASIAAALSIAVGGLAWVSIVQGRASEALGKKNVELAAATQAATQRSEDVLSLSAIQDLKDLEARADLLWPADPGNLPAYEAWLVDARRLVEGEAADLQAGRKRRPSLAEHEAKLLEIRSRGRRLAPSPPAAGSPRFAEWSRARSRLEWIRRMLGTEPWPPESDVGAELAKESLPADVTSLNRLAWRLVDPNPGIVLYGQEVRGLLIARRALAAAGDPEPAQLHDTLAWALFRTGRFDEARAEEARAIARADPARKSRYEGYAADLERAIAEWTGESARSTRTSEADGLAAQIAGIEAGSGGEWEFENGEDRWWHAQLGELVADLKAFRDERAGGIYSTGVSGRHGWGILRRAEFARTIFERSVGGAEAKRRWDEAIAAIAASPRYGGLRVQPQPGLLPIGADPGSRLFEFADLATGTPPDRGSDGRIALEASTGIVFVLIPGGTFRMGAQAEDTTAPNYDPEASESEMPVHEVTLSPYFLSKYEMTQGQWERFTGTNPSSYGPGRYDKDWNRQGKGWTALHPVELLTWGRCVQVLSRLGMSLPSEAQWECGARGGTDTPFWTGSDVESLKNAGNLCDAFGQDHGGESWTTWEKELDDGSSVHAEVGSYRPNPFGLHDVCGNVAEWCLDGYDPSFYALGSAVDPVAPWIGTDGGVMRGGSFSETAFGVRSALRMGVKPENQRDVFGLRPARKLEASALRPAPAGK